MGQSRGQRVGWLLRWSRGCTPGERKEVFGDGAVAVVVINLCARPDAAHSEIDNETHFCEKLH